MAEKTRKAAALQYRHLMDQAPVVVAKGRGIIAERIIEIAKKHNIPLKSDPALIEVLSKLDLDQAIPTELYRAVAEVLAYVYKMTKKLWTGWGDNSNSHSQLVDYPGQVNRGQARISNLCCMSAESRGWYSKLE